MSLNGQMVKEKGYLDGHHDTASLRVSRQADRGRTVLPYSRLSESAHAVYWTSTEVLRHVRQDRHSTPSGWEKPAPNALREKDMLKDTVGNIRKCAAGTTALDDQIPVLIRKLQERKLWDNTLILFTGDNGYLLGRHGLWSKGLASDPTNMYDEVVKVPMIISWPGKIRPAKPRRR